MNGNATEEIVLPGFAEPLVEGRTESSAGDVAGDWLCGWCLNRVANERDRFRYDGHDEFNFANPEGIHFEIITFSQTLGCRKKGVPTLAFTWVPGHAWSYCQCSQCGHHLGWYYTGNNSFVGLIKARLVRALYVRN